MRQKRACCTMPPPSGPPPTAQISFEIRTSLYCILVLAQWPPPLCNNLVVPPRCANFIWNLHNDPPWTTPPLRKIHVHPFWQDPAGCARSMFTHCARSMFLPTAQDPCPPTAQYPCPPTTEDPCPPLKHAQYILRSMEADHCRVLPTGRGKHGTQQSTMELNMKTQTHTS